MKAKEAVVKTQQINFFDKTGIYDFNLTPCNEGQPMGFLENYRGNVEDLFIRCNKIVEGLKSLFPSGEFSVLVENYTFDDYILFVPAIGVFDKDDNLILNLSSTLSN